MRLCFAAAIPSEKSQAKSDGYEGPIAKPVSGYGAEGIHSINRIAFDNPAYKNGNQPEIFYAGDIPGPLPTIFFSHGFGATRSTFYQGMMDFLARKGYAVVYVPYPIRAEDVEARYTILWSGFKEAVRKYPQIIDTTKVGFAGHSFGGGASFSLAYKGFVEEGWGEKGRFIFSLAPWYSYSISDKQLAGFPKNTKLLMEVYADDEMNDHRMAIDIFNSIGIDNSEKDYVVVESDDVDGYTYRADHSLPVTHAQRQRPLDAYDYYAVYRLLDALIDYSLNNNAAAKDIALGNGSAQQVTMPSYKQDTLKPLIVTDQPQPSHDSKYYFFPCSSQRNPRAALCN
ncbi:MAG TPA: hypothetical protein VIN08_11130 [Ohtaekwangia sp.]|uniref:alpha/beta hydrolase family protein n=1 Tax=Ohtaekwangia sp. TaxID=2066019 RepID=UPI002F95BB8A